MNTGGITIVASYNVGLFLKGQRLPGPGETVIADSFYEGGGGKGSNQALAASVLGAPTRLVVRIGTDQYGDDALAMYNRYGISTDNKHEAGVLTGIPVRGVEDALRAGRGFIEHGVKTAIITLGELGAVWVTQNGEGHFLPPTVQAIDTTGAGDTFSGAFMAAVSRGKPLEESIRFANTAAAMSVTRLGVVEAIPQLAEVQAFQSALAEAA